MPQCHLPVFCYFCVSEMLHRKYSRNWTKQVPEVLFSRTKDEDRKRAGGGPGASLTPGRRGPAPGRAPYVGGDPGSPLTTPLRLYKASGWKTLEESAKFPEQFRSSVAAANEFWGTEVSVLAPCRDGKVPTEPSPSTSPPSPSTLLSPMMRRE
jgi:hypothetical protein